MIDDSERKKIEIGIDALKSVLDDAYSKVGSPIYYESDTAIIFLKMLLNGLLMR